MGYRTLLVTMNLDTVALMPCNPSVGGPAKGHVVREIDALGGEMARNTDRTSIQIRMLNVRKGPAVQVPRAQCDKKMYALSMKTVLETTPNLYLKQATISGLLLEPLEASAGEEQLAPTLSHEAGAADDALALSGEETQGRRCNHCHRRTYLARSVVLTTGTFLRGRIISGEFTSAAGRSGEAPSKELSGALGELRFPLMRLKTGTPPRIDARTIDFSLTELQPGSPTPLYFSHERIKATELEPLATYPKDDDGRRTTDDGEIPAVGPGRPRSATMAHPDVLLPGAHHARNPPNHPRQPPPFSYVQRADRGRGAALLPFYRGQGASLRPQGRATSFSLSLRAGAPTRYTCRGAVHRCPKTPSGS